MDASGNLGDFFSNGFIVPIYQTDVTSFCTSLFLRLSVFLGLGLFFGEGEGDGNW